MKVDVELEPFKIPPYYGPRMQTRMRERSQKYACRGTSLDIRAYARALPPPASASGSPMVIPRALPPFPEAPVGLEPEAARIMND